MIAMWYSLIFFVAGVELSSGATPWTFQCVQGKCNRALKEDVPIGERMTLNKCRLTCSGDAMLWPLPSKQYILGKNVVSFPSNNVMTSVKAPSLTLDEMSKEGIAIFLKNIGADTTQVASPDKRILNISIEIVWPDTSLTYETDESYTLSIVDDGTNSQVLILSNTYFGTRHALETLSQLIAPDERTGALIVLDQATISDAPAFPHRGLTLDTSRNYYPLEKLYKVVDALSYNKINVLHWHLSDTNSFPFVSRREPNMAFYGAYADGKVYEPSDVKTFVDYARIRGVKVIPELDAPAHTGHGWEWGEKKGKGRFVFCLEEFDWQTYCVQPPCGQLNPVNDAMYAVLGNVYKDFFEVFDNDVFHFGGDEISMRCWTDPKVGQEAVQWLQAKNLSLDQEGVFHLWDYFNNQAYKQITLANKGKEMPVIVWSSKLTEPEQLYKYLNASRYIVQIWDDLSDLSKQEKWLNVTRNGYKVIISNYDAMYLDCGYGSWVGGPPKNLNNWCSPYKSWQQIYNNNPLQLESKDGVLGFEVCMWSEIVDANSLDGKLWPRSAAMAERAWTNPKTGFAEAEYRMIQHRQRLVDRGVEADALQPYFCYLNQGRCYI